MTTQFTLIQFTLLTKQRRRIVRQEPCWLATASFADGPGMKVKKMTTTRDIQKAARFSLVTAHNIAVQFSHLPASLVRPDGSVLEAESSAVQAEQRRRHDEHHRLKRDMNRDLNALFESAAEMLR